jgi:hypothetical protein
VQVAGEVADAVSQDHAAIGLPGSSVIAGLRGIISRRRIDMERYRNPALALEEGVMPR